MTKEEIEKGNTLIAEFIGTKYNGGVGLVYIEGSQSTMKPIEELEFHSSWDWIIPVAQKCCSLIQEEGPDFNGQMGIEELNAKKIFTAHINNTIESIYRSVIEFIEWHNKKGEPLNHQKL